MQGAAGQRCALALRAPTHEGGEAGVHQRQVLDDHPVSRDADPLATASEVRHLEDGRAFHGPDAATSLCQLDCHAATLTRMRIVIAHGASGRAASMQAHVDGFRQRGVAAFAIDLPLRRAEAAVPAYREAISAQAEPSTELIVGGQSYGGRVASLLAAADRSACAGLICFSYPLHRPGQPDWEGRTVHWPAIAVPTLLLSGESDPFARIDLLRHACAQRLPTARLVTYPKVGHSLRPVLEDALDEAAAFVRALEEGWSRG